MNRNIVYYENRVEAFDKAEELTKTNKTPYMVYEFPGSVAYAVMDEEFFMEGIRKEGFEIRKLGTYSLDQVKYDWKK